MNSSDMGIIAANKMTVVASKTMQHDFDQAVEFLSAYISNRHTEAQTKYANFLTPDWGSRLGCSFGMCATFGARGIQLLMLFMVADEFDNNRLF